MSIRLIVPTSEHIPAILVYKNLFLESLEVIHGSSQLVLAETGEDWLEQIDRNRSRETVAPEYVPAEQYIALDDETGEVIGMLNFRKSLNDYLYNYAGHIGYSVSPLRRRQGIGSEILRLALPEAETFGIDRVLITCTDDNLASAGVIEKNGGVLEDKRVDPGDGELTRRYWIEIKK
ncbi:GNAT family N-acetyltransferase [Chryseomicrobium sp. FSL W7-1435]|uniref:GNAT family N-acetyltransferase n=1 Tax=Chryseomicrobium sp. FSL W7-1435 TaxID=2921704 RepID=UPI00315A1B42